MGTGCRHLPAFHVFQKFSNFFGIKLLLHSGYFPCNKPLPHTSSFYSSCCKFVNNIVNRRSCLVLFPVALYKWTGCDRHICFKPYCICIVFSHIFWLAALSFRKCSLPAALHCMEFSTGSLYARRSVCDSPGLSNAVITAVPKEAAIARDFCRIKDLPLFLIY